MALLDPVAQAILFQTVLIIVSVTIAFHHPRNKRRETIPGMDRAVPTNHGSNLFIGLAVAAILYRAASFPPPAFPVSGSVAERPLACSRSYRYRSRETTCLPSKTASEIW